MTTSSTYNFNPGLGEAVLYAFNRCGIRSAALLQEHMESARMGANMVCVDFSNRGVNLWQVDLLTTPLVQGTATYSVDPSTVVILDGYISTTSGGVTTDRLILPISRTEYSSYPNKQQQGFPTTFWNDRLLNPTVTLWPVPDGTQTSFQFYVLRQIQDANFTSGQNVDVPYLWLKCFTDALSVELAVIWAPDKVSMLSGLAELSYTRAADTNIETAQQYISPTIAPYFRA
jgi:hypothetical protein